MKWEIEYVVGRLDDPQHGQLIVEASTVKEACGQAYARCDIKGSEIVRVELTDLNRGKRKKIVCSAPKKSRK